MYSNMKGRRQITRHILKEEVHRHITQVYMLHINTRRMSKLKPNLFGSTIERERYGLWTVHNVRKKTVLQFVKRAPSI